MRYLILLSRVLFGLAALALGLHFLTGFVAISAIGSPLANELISAFADTGLLAAASLALVAGGMLIVFDRLTVAALAATAPVLVCCLYWAILVGDLTHLLAAGVALGANALLLLAYWPHCRQLFAMRTPSASELGEEPGAIWIAAERYSRYIWGGWYVISGLFHFVTGPLIGTSPLAVQLIMALLHTRLYEVVKATEAIGGAAVLTRRWPALLLLINLPITLVVAYWDVGLQDPFGLIGIAVSVLTLGTTFVLMRAYRPYYGPLVAWRPRHMWNS